MPNQEEQHKKWRMLKKADKSKYIPFTKDIIPNFRNSNSVTNEYGTWSASTAGNVSSSSAWPMFDKSNSATLKSVVGKGKQGHMYIYLNLPSTIEISVEETQIKWDPGQPCWLLAVEGYDEKRKEWIPIIEENGTDAYPVTIQTINKNYYNKFRLYTYRTDTSSSYGISTYFTEWTFTKGTIKVINGLA